MRVHQDVGWAPSHATSEVWEFPPILQGPKVNDFNKSRRRNPFWHLSDRLVPFRVVEPRNSAWQHLAPGVIIPFKVYLTHAYRCYTQAPPAAAAGDAWRLSAISTLPGRPRWRPGSAREVKSQRARPGSLRVGFEPLLAMRCTYVNPV